MSLSHGTRRDNFTTWVSQGPYPAWIFNLLWKWVLSILITERPILQEHRASNPKSSLESSKPKHPNDPKTHVKTSQGGEGTISGWDLRPFGSPDPPPRRRTPSKARRLLASLQGHREGLRLALRLATRPFFRVSKRKLKLHARTHARTHIEGSFGEQYSCPIRGHTHTHQFGGSQED